MNKTLRGKETEKFAKWFRPNQNTGYCPECGFNIDLDIAPYKNGVAICGDCFLKEENKMYDATKVKTFTPVLPGPTTGPTGTQLSDALYDIFNDLNEENVPVEPFSDTKIQSLVDDFIALTGMNDWVDGEYPILDDYKIKIKHMAKSAFEEMPEFNGY
jgi:hypothetical protein